MRESNVSSNKRRKEKGDDIMELIDSDMISKEQMAEVEEKIIMDCDNISKFFR